MIDRAVAGMADADRAGLRLGLGQRALHVREAAVGAGHDHRRHGGEQADRREQRHHRRLARHVGRDPHDAEAAHDDGVAVGRCGDRRLEADDAAGAGAVVDQHGLPQPPGHRLADDPRGDVVVATGCERNDPADRLVGKVLRPCRHRRHGSTCAGKARAQKFPASHFHAPSLPNLQTRDCNVGAATPNPMNRQPTAERNGECLTIRHR